MVKEKKKQKGLGPLSLGCPVHSHQKQSTARKENFIEIAIQYTCFIFACTAWWVSSRITTRDMLLLKLRVYFCNLNQSAVFFPNKFLTQLWMWCFMGYRNLMVYTNSCQLYWRLNWHAETIEGEGWGCMWMFYEIWMRSAIQMDIGTDHACVCVCVHACVCVCVHACMHACVFLTDHAIVLVVWMTVLLKFTVSICSWHTIVFLISLILFKNYVWGYTYVC